MESSEDLDLEYREVIERLDKGDFSPSNSSLYNKKASELAFKKNLVIFHELENDFKKFKGSLKVVNNPKDAFSLLKTKYEEYRKLHLRVQQLLRDVEEKKKEGADLKVALEKVAPDYRKRRSSTPHSKEVYKEILRY